MKNVLFLVVFAAICSLAYAGKDQIIEIFSPGHIKALEEEYLAAGIQNLFDQQRVFALESQKAFLEKIEKGMVAADEELAVHISRQLPVSNDILDQAKRICILAGYIDPNTGREVRVKWSDHVSILYFGGNKKEIMEIHPDRDGKPILLKEIDLSFQNWFEGDDFFGLAPYKYVYIAE